MSGLESNGEMELLRVHLRGGQTIEMVVSDWGLRKNNLEGELSELRWTAVDGKRMPFVRLDAVDAVVVTSVPEVSR